MDNNFLLLNLKEIVLQCTTDGDFKSLDRRIDEPLFLDLDYYNQVLFVNFLVTQSYLVYEDSCEFLLESFTMRIIMCWRKHDFGKGSISYVVHDSGVLKNEEVTKFALKLAQYNIIPVAYSIEFFDDVVKGFIRI